MRLVKLVLPVLLAASVSVDAGEFINLGFDEPELGGRMVPIFPDGPELGLTKHLLQGWTLTANGIAEEFTTYSLSNQTSGNTPATLREGAPDSSFGNYLVLASFVGNDGTQGPDLWLSQTGTVPKDAVGLWVFGDPPIEAYMDGVKIGFIDPNLGKTVWNVEAFQGKTVNLQIHSPAGSVNRFDIRGFTTVPEPSEYAMFGLGLSLLGWQAWKQRGGRGSTHAQSSFADPVRIPSA